MLVYLDYAATTKLDIDAFDEMLPYYTERFFNPSSLYWEARAVRADVNSARSSVANAINAESDEIIFTGSGTESDNMAIKGVALSQVDKGRHLITSQTEHHAVLNTFKWLETQGFEVTYLPVTPEGTVDPEVVRKAIRPDTTLMSFMWVNNETGTINDIETLCTIKNDHNILFHTDAVQALKTETIDVKSIDVDLLTVSAHKINGPKGIGALYCKKGIGIPSFVHGGSQESGHRAGTESVVNIIGFGSAAEKLMERKGQALAHISMIKSYLLEKLSEVDGMMINGDARNSAPTILNLGFSGLQTEPLLIHLNHKGICASMGAACNSQTIEPSYVLKAMGVPEEYIEGCIRFSFDKETTTEEIDYTAKELIRIISKLRR